MISSRLILGVNANPSPSSSPLQQGERRPVPQPGEVPGLQHILIAFWLRHTNYRHADPSHSSSSRQQRGEATRIAGRRGACPTICFDRVLAASHQLPLRRARRSRPTNSAFACRSIARSQVCRLEFRRRICAQYLRATGCSRAMPGSSAHNRRAFQNRNSSGA